MTEQQFKLEIPAQIKEVAEKTIDQAERGFSAFIEAANKSVSMIRNPTTDMSLKALSHTEQNMKAALIALSGAKLRSLLDQAIPGFGEHYDSAARGNLGYPGAAQQPQTREYEVSTHRM